MRCPSCIAPHTVTLTIGDGWLRSYWKSVLLDILSKHKGNLSIKDMSQLTAIKPGSQIEPLAVKSTPLARQPNP